VNDEKDPARVEAGKRAHETRERREQYVQTKVDAYQRFSGKKPTKALMKEWTDKSKEVVD